MDKHRNRQDKFQAIGSTLVDEVFTSIWCFPLLHRHRRRDPKLRKFPERVECALKRVDKPMPAHFPRLVVGQLNAPCPLYGGIRKGE